MSEEQEKEEVKLSKKQQVQDELIQRASDAAIRLEKANVAMSNNLDRHERLFVENTLSGKAEAGKESKKEETPKEYAQRVMEGGV